MALQKLKQSLDRRGLGGTIKRIGLYARDALRWHLDARFDRTHNVQTSGKTSLADLRITSKNISDATWYEPVPRLAFQQLLRELPIDYEDYDFIDFGSGKGRALFLAADHPFRKVTGVEFSPELHAMCLQNIKTYRSARQRCFRIESVCKDVVDFEMPPVQSVYFFYSPFRAAVFAQVMDNLMNSLSRCPRSVYLLFIGLIPEGIEVLMKTKLNRREVKLGPDYIRWEKKRGLIFHSGIPILRRSSR